MLIYHEAEHGVGTGGFWTLASLFGDALAERLSANAGIAFGGADPAIIFSDRGDRA